MSHLPPIILSDLSSNHTENDCACPDKPFITTGSFEEVEDDCACPDKPFHLAAFTTAARSDLSHKKLSRTPPMMKVSPDLCVISLPHDFTLAFSPFAPAGPAVLNPQAMTHLQTFTVPQPIEQPIDYTLAACGLLIPAEQKPSMIWDRPVTLTSWLHVTNACNLDCPYCYVRKSSARMSDEIGIRAIDSTFQTAAKYGFQAIKLKYAGGEAALHFKLIQRLHDYAQALADEKNLQLRSVVLSNGTIWTSAMAHWLVKSGIKLMISIDGVGQAHDAQRPTRSGKSTFTRIEYIVDKILLPAGVLPDISITITGQNASAAAEAVAWAIERDLPFSLNFYRENLLSAKYETLKLEETLIIEGMRKAYQVVEKSLPTRPFLNGLLDRVQVEAHAHTCGVGQNYLVFTHTGQVAQCQMHLEDGKAIKKVDDTINLVKQGFIPVISVDDKEGCRTCTWRYRCTGGCPLETYRATGRFDVQSPHCNIYSTLFPEALRLEGLRLMKLEGYLS